MGVDDSLVTRLRWWAQTPEFGVCGEAADEIERLREALESIADDDPSKGYDHVSRAAVALGREAPRW